MLMQPTWLNKKKFKKIKKIERLALIDTCMKDDPYSLGNNKEFENDVIKWPPVEYFLLFHQMSMIVYPRRHQLLQWKSLEAYNYFQSGHVRVARIRKLTQCCIMIAHVNPSQTAPDKAQLAWVPEESEMKFNNI